MSKVIEIDINETLQYIKDGNNSPQRIMALCSDLFPKNHKDRNFLNMAVVAGIAERIRKSPDVDSFKRRAYISELVNDYGMQKEFVEEIIDCWINVYTPVEKIVERENILLNDKIEELSEELRQEREKSAKLEQKITELKTDLDKYKNGNKISGDSGSLLEYEGISIISCDRRATTIDIPEYINGKCVEKVGDCSFSHCTRLTKIDIPTSVRDIGSYAFYRCKSLTQVIIPSSVIYRCIGDYAFYGCKNLTQIIIPRSIKSIGKRTFAGCKSLVQVTILSSRISIIEDGAFCGCESLTQITIPSPVKSIGSHAFSMCKSLVQVTIPSSVTSIGSSAFSGCKNLTQVTIPSSVTSIGGSAFGRCIGLTSIKLPNTFRGRHDLGINESIITYY